MPANLTPQYQRAEEEYRKAQTAPERLEILERMLQLIPKHKGTEKLQADLKSKLKETREELQTEKSAPKGGKVYKFPRQGAAQIVIIGGPNAGKSRILKELTKAEPEVAPYPFTTREPLPGMMTWEDVAVQLVDTPPMTDSQCEPYLLNFVRTADLVVLAFDGSSDDAPEQTSAVLEQLQQRKTRLAALTAFDEDDFSILQVRTLMVATRGADAGLQDRLEFFREMTGSTLPVFATDLDDPGQRETLRNRLFAALDLIRLYTKAPGKPADYSSPFTLPVGGTVEDLAAKVHRDLAEKLKFAKVWRAGAGDGQSVGRDYVLADKDLVELHS
ncbi:GTPase [Planctellipticum variicoloris]|uniref:GTPase n=1 Tax=Planctellipticum variicoloris TaxID=3064265 RepID=UPI003013BED3|nr:50S ribosome-binding GTPase [Planctomycetaceae bacterium SH412]